jgi:hypothetical protein
VPAVLVRGCVAARQPDGAHAVAIPLTRLLLHEDVLCRSSVVGLSIHAQLLVKKSQLLVELAPRLYELVEPCPPLGVDGAVAQSRLRFGVARC